MAAASLLLIAATFAFPQETPVEPASGGDESAQEGAPATEQEQAEDIEDTEDAEKSVPPTPPPPDGILPVGEFARFEHSPRDRPHVLLVGDYLIVSTRGGIVQGVDGLSGQLLWKLGMPGEELFPAVALAPPDPLSILLSTPSGRLFFVDAKTGRIVSEKRLAFSLALEPFVSEAGILYAGTPEGVVHGHDLESDTELFATETGEAPNAFAASSSLLAVSGGGQTLTALDPRRGSVKWTHLARGPFFAQATFDRSGERLYIGSDTGEFYCLEALNGKVKFSWPTGAAIRSPALVEGNRVYVASYGNTLYAYGAGNGHEQWRAHLPGRPASGPVRVYQRFIVATQDGTLIEIEPSRGHLAKRYTVPGEISFAPAFRVVPPPPLTLSEALESTLEGSTQDEEPPMGEELTEPEEPKWYELSRIALSLKSGQVLLLAHQPPEREEPEEPEGVEDSEERPVEPPGESFPVPF